MDSVKDRNRDQDCMYLVRGLVCNNLIRGDIVLLLLRDTRHLQRGKQGYGWEKMRILDHRNIIHVDHP